MKLTWVNHASYIIEHNGVKLITDPWIDGTTFDNGWALLSKSVFTYEDFKDIQYIWFSHEHPDHFNPPNINKIPVEYRSKITVLFQNTTDRKVAAYCKKAGFLKVIEMEADTYYPLGTNFECMCNAFAGGDSWLYIKTDKYQVLNLNDCEIKTAEHCQDIQQKIGKVDVLLTQFGYANKVGNIADQKLRLEQSMIKLQRVDLQQKVFNPSTIIPFASYIYFCHTENNYMNDGINRIDKVYDYISTQIKKNCVILYPGEDWDLVSEHDNQASIQKYLVDYENLASGKIEYVQPKSPISIEDLTNEGRNFTTKIMESMKVNMIFKLLPTMKIWLTDHQKSYVFNFKAGLKNVTIDKDSCDIQLSSEALFFAFKNLYGGDTLNINARFQTTPNGNYKKARAYFKLASFTNRLEKITLSFMVSKVKALYKK